MVQLVRAIVGVAWDVLRLVVSFLRSSRALGSENLVLRKQLARYLERGIKPRRVDHATRVSLALFTRLFDWHDTVVIVRPATIVRWHRTGWRIFWRWKCRAGRPSSPPELRSLIRRMAAENPLWGEERIANELLVKLGIRVSPRTVGKYMPKRPPGQPRGDQRWSTFLRNHAKAILVIGTIRRECLDWMIPLSEAHLRSILKSWVEHYSRGRPHSMLGPGVPDPSRGAAVVPKSESRYRLAAGALVLAKSVLGGLHHEYSITTVSASA